jgi:hypothetical protein
MVSDRADRVAGRTELRQKRGVQDSDLRLSAPGVTVSTAATAEKASSWETTPAPQALVASRRWRSSWAASSTALWRHSAARYWHAIRPDRWTRRKSP